MCIQTGRSFRPRTGRIYSTGKETPSQGFQGVEGSRLVLAAHECRPPFLLLARTPPTVQMQGKHAEAEPLYKRSLAIKNKEYGPDHADLAAGLGHLATLLETVVRPAISGEYGSARGPRFRARRAVVCGSSMGIHTP